MHLSSLTHIIPSPCHRPAPKPAPLGHARAYGGAPSSPPPCLRVVVRASLSIYICVCSQLLFLLGLVAHWVSCCWFLIGWVALQQNGVWDANGAYVGQGISPEGTIADVDAFDMYSAATASTYGDSWLLRHFGAKDLNGDWPREGNLPPVANAVAYM